MALRILIAEPNDILRMGLRTILKKDPRVSVICEAVSEDDLQAQLACEQLDMVFINQALLAHLDIAAHADKNIVLLAAEPDIQIVKTAYRHGARGYVSINISAELLHFVLYPAKNAFLVEPALIPWMIDQLENNSRDSLEHELLTPREQEILNLLRKGYKRDDIARELCISKNTLKTHVRKISRKRNTVRLHQPVPGGG